jgi:hypothetical protein
VPAAPVATRLVRAAYAPLAWVVVFFAFHIYWYAGGLVGRAGPLPDATPDSVRGWIFEVLVVAAFPLGAWVCVAIARGWPRGKMRRAAAILVWVGCVLLAFRSAAGLIFGLLAYRYRHSRSSPVLPAALVALRDGQVRGNVGLMIPASS